MEIIFIIDLFLADLSNNSYNLLYLVNFSPLLIINFFKVTAIPALINSFK